MDSFECPAEEQRAFISHNPQRNPVDDCESKGTKQHHSHDERLTHALFQEKRILKKIPDILLGLLKHQPEAITQELCDEVLVAREDEKQCKNLLAAIDMVLYSQ